MIEAGQLQDGDRLPSSRLLAAHLAINRNTVARAYAELRDEGFVVAKRRSGMVVAGAGEARDRARTREEAREILRGAVARCMDLGLSAGEISSLAYHPSLHVAPHLTTLVRLAQLPKTSRIGILYSTRDQAESIQQSFAQANLRNVDVIEARDGEPVTGYDVVVIPSEHPDFRARLGEETEVIEFGNLLDVASIKMVGDVIGEIRDRKALTYGP